MIIFNVIYCHLNMHDARILDGETILETLGIARSIDEPSSGKDHDYSGEGRQLRLFQTRPKLVHLSRRPRVR